MPYGVLYKVPKNTVFRENFMALIFIFLKSDLFYHIEESIATMRLLLT